MYNLLPPYLLFYCMVLCLLKRDTAGTNLIKMENRQSYMKAVLGFEQLSLYLVTCYVNALPVILESLYYRWHLFFLTNGYTVFRVDDEANMSVHQILHCDAPTLSADRGDPTCLISISK